ncbi:hypothetical protein DFH07DRAFT_770916 [Mycena maculata]|uniref:CCHC-type domain-containing protein n=1 Tax=Mycena maculata TaxID=230809 RepID=A0AAD7JH32_9AGAR|nr:hypothetical protein DFH07DRAFT_770916 [Mycena maculata]
MQQKLSDSVTQLIKKEEDAEDDPSNVVMAATAQFNWGNSKEKDGVCHCCGRSGHVARHCIADMPDNVKAKYLASSKRNVDAGTAEDCIVFGDSDDEDSVAVYADTHYIPSNNSNSHRASIHTPVISQSNTPSSFQRRRRKIVVDIEVVVVNVLELFCSDFAQGDLPN